MHVRYMLHRRYWARILERMRRLRAAVASQWELFAMPQFIDYHPAVPGTIPEKMLFEALHQMRINFAFSYLVGDAPMTTEEEKLRPDFILYDYNVVIEVAGTYWHNLPGKKNTDMLRHMLLTAMGFKVYIFTDMEILLFGAEEVLRQVTEITNASIRGGNIIIGDRPYDPSASIKARLTKWPRHYPVRYKDPTYGDKIARASWEPFKAPIHKSAEVKIPFTHRDLTALYNSLFDGFDGSISEWMKALGKMFNAMPAMRRRYRTLWRYYKMWLEREFDTDPWTIPEEWDA